MAKPLASKKLNGMNYLAWKHVLQFFLRENWHKIQEHEVWNCEDAIVMWAGIGVWLMVIRTEECPMQFDMQTVCKYPLKLILSSPRIPTLHDSEKSQKWNWDLSFDWTLLFICPLLQPDIIWSSWLIWSIFDRLSSMMMKKKMHLNVICWLSKH